MSANTAIAWTQRTWNPIVGCTKVSPGCAHCYAETLHTLRHQAFKRGKLQNIPQYAKSFETVQLMHGRVEDPLRWRKPSLVFVNSMSDLFHEDVPDEFIDEVFGVIRLTPWHTYQILTKRPERMRDYMLETWKPDATQTTGDDRDERTHRAAERFLIGRTNQSRFWTDDERSISIVQPWPLPNVWLGASVENQRHAHRLSVLADVPASLRFVSAEPLLGPLDIHEHLLRHEQSEGIHWVIAGGESGALHRSCELDWLRSLRDQCADTRVPYFLKQLGGHPDSRSHEKAVLDGRTHTEMPKVANG